jgi:endonuclease G
MVAFLRPWLRLALIFALTATLATGCQLINRQPEFKTIPGNHLSLGNPSQANASNPNNLLMLKPQFALSYNGSQGTPNWVAWELNQSWFGNAERQNDFHPDKDLPENIYRVTPKDYNGTGYDRGHVAPSADRTRNLTDNSATFAMSNMMPQSPGLNRGVWGDLEEYCRQLARQGKELYIVAGPVGKKGSIANGKVIVPQASWKAIAVLDKPGASLTSNTRIIAVLMPNQDRLTKWTDYRVSVDKIEAATGYDLMPNLPKGIQNAIESKADSETITRQR